ncbi:MAG: DUF488 domain-containing protein [Cyanobacteria bacterium J06649_12]
MRELVITFGYGNRKDYSVLEEVFDDFGVDILIDVRLKPRAWTRKWWGDQVKVFCEASNVKYMSLPALGNISGKAEWIPPNIEEAERSLEMVKLQAKSKTVLLMCAELDYKRCHRTEIAQRLSNSLDKEIHHVA